MLSHRKTIIEDSDPQVHEKKTPIISKISAFSGRFKFSGAKDYAPLLNESDDVVINTSDTNPIHLEGQETLPTKGRIGKSPFHREDQEGLPVKGFKRY